MGVLVGCDGIGVLVGRGVLVGGGDVGVAGICPGATMGMVSIPDSVAT